MNEAIVDSPARRTRWLRQAADVLRIEAQAVAALVDRIGQPFVDACGLILACEGRVIVSGIGKSGHVARKLAATFASTGTPSFFVHPAEAQHGDLGMVTGDDVFVALSNSGATEELIAIVPLVKRMGARLIALTGAPDSPLARLADVHLDVSVEREACPLNLAPTASTAAAMAMGDALALTLLDARGFNADDFASSHPGGRLGRRLLTRVADVMRTGEAIPTVRAGARLSDAILEVTRRRMGMTAVLDDGGALRGIFTDGDLRRVLERGGDVRMLAVDDVMSRTPVTIDPEALAAEAVKRMEDRRISVLLVVDATGALVGAVHIHDLLAAKVA
ncbi:MAG TPA: KpsF/GutQ family sugar-phosphate isomerase [Burkholderiaceae bacterium]|nr:KpsF/GutQ family sugar-phosphate isomerase [Burkholderiaceae bacterium]